MGDKTNQQKPREKSPPPPGPSSAQQKLSSLRTQKTPGPSPLKDGIPSYYFTPRKAFSQEVASSPLISDLEMDTLTAECGDIMRAVESMTSEEEASPVKMGPPSTQKYHAMETPNTKKDREVRQMLLQDLECSESERDTPFKRDSPLKNPVNRVTAVTPEASTSAQAKTPEETKELPEPTKPIAVLPVAAPIPGLVPSKSMSFSRQQSSSSEADSSQDSTDESSGNELDVYSSKFNPQKALKMGREFLPKLPFPLTKRLLNLAEYNRIATKSENPEDFEKHMARTLRNRTKKKKKKNEPVARNFLPEQMPVQSTWMNRQEKNLLGRMEGFTGPLAKLAEYRDKKIRVMVKTRNIHQGTNDMVAYLVAFDKHWNMALTDVEETFIRKKRRKVPASLGEPVRMPEIELERRGLVRPKVIKKIGSKLELCKRHLPQLMIRGEQIVIIYPIV